MKRRARTSSQPSSATPGSLNNRRRNMLLHALLADAKLEDMSADEVDEHVEQVLTSYAEEFPMLLGLLKQGVTRTDPVRLLAWLSTTKLLGTFDWDPEQVEPFSFLQPHLELLQALVLQHPQSAFNWNAFRPEVHADAIETITKRLAMLFMLKRWTPEARARAVMHPAAVEFTRGHTQHVRNWAYPEQMQRIVTGLFTKFDDKVESISGVQVEPLVQMIYAIVDEGEKRLSQLIKTSLLVRGATSKRQAVSAVRQLPGDPAGDQFEWKVNSPAISLQQLQQTLSTFLDNEMEFFQTFTPEHFVDQYDGVLSLETAVSILELWSIEFGELAGENAEHFFLDNPIWSRPLIKLTDRLYFVPILGLLNSFCLELVEGLFMSNQDLWKDYQNRYRAEFLEAETARLFRQAFPTAEIYCGVKRAHPNQGETDVIVLVESGAIIVEAKSGRFGEYARRGAANSLRTDCDELVIEPARQVGRLLDFLRDNPGPHSLPASDGRTITLDLNSLSWIAPLSVTLDASSLQFLRWNDLLSANLAPDDVDPVPGMNIADLECILLLLNSPAERIHYLRRRAEVETTPGYAGSELDLLAFYLETGFDDAETGEDLWPAGLFLHYKEIDPFLRNWFAKRPTVRPKRQLTKRWRRMIEWLEHKQPQGWVEMSCALRDVNLTQQKNLERRWGQRGDRLRGARRTPNPNHFVHIPSSKRPSTVTLAFVSHGNLTTTGLERLLREISIEILDAIDGKVAILASDVHRGQDSLSGALLIEP